MKTSNSAVSSPALDGDTLYLGSNEGVYALNATTGALVWQVLTGPEFYASPAITGPPRPAGAGDRGQRGSSRSAWPTGQPSGRSGPTPAGFWASPAISQGSIYTVGLDGVLRTYAPSGS